MKRERILILGAAGRDFHNFNTCFRECPNFEVVGFTAAQIPHIESRIYPPELSGRLYPEGLPTWPESDLERIIQERKVDKCILAYSDLCHMTVMNIASRILATGADFELLGPRQTMLKSKKPVVAVCAVRTGSGKSQTSRYVARQLRAANLKVVVVRHPMPYGDLAKEVVQRFASLDDLKAAEVTFEEREEYESHIKNGTVVYAGVDYEEVLLSAEAEADVIIWDGGNNDIPFFKPDLWITVADSLRPGHEVTYHPGETNFRAADVIVINKANCAPPDATNSIKANAARVNPKAEVIVAASEVTAEDPEAISGKRVLIVEDGPSFIHGELSYGAGKAAAEKYGASEIVDPRPFAVGSIKTMFQEHEHLGKLLPAMGYYPLQVKEIEETINNADCDSVIIATPFDLRRIVKIDKPATGVTYELADMERPRLRDTVKDFISNLPDH